MAALLIFNGSAAYLGILIVCVMAILVNRQGKHAGGEPPRRPGVGSPADCPGH